MNSWTVSKLIFFVVTTCIVGRCDVLESYTDCGSTGVIKEVNVENCAMPPCQLKKGTSVGLEIHFQTNENADKLEIQMFGVLGTLDIPWNGVDKDACANITSDNGQTKCPIKDGTEELVYKNKFNVLKAYPSIELPTKIKITNPASPDKAILCFTFKVKLTD